MMNSVVPMQKAASDRAKTAMGMNDLGSGTENLPRRRAGPATRCKLMQAGGCKYASRES